MPTSDRHVSASAVLEAARELLGVDHITVDEDILRDAFVVRVRVPAVEHAVRIDRDALVDARFASYVLMQALQPLRERTATPARRSGRDVARVAFAAEAAFATAPNDLWSHLLEDA